MSIAAANESATAPARPPTTMLSRMAAVLVLLLLAATFLLISPRPGQTYPGARPWSDTSLLRPITQLMSLNGLAATERGVEVKDLAFHLAAAVCLLLVGVRVLLTRGVRSRTRLHAIDYAQILLTAWGLIALLSSLWSDTPGFARGQALVYALAVAWAVSVAAIIDSRHIAKLLAGLVAISTIAATLCVWYYHERNPFHRPGFPLGNANVLAAAILPATLICIVKIWTTARQAVRTKRFGGGLWAVGALVAMVMLTWCLVLTWGRGALLALLIGLVVIGLLSVGRRLRLTIACLFIIGLAGLSTWWLHASRLDVAMARSATIRFRLYAWRYAADLWQQRPMTGHGAGSYPLLAGQFAIRDRTLDPAAFMGEIVEHAHNELFEVLTEVGFVGGIAFVGAFVATLLAAMSRLRTMPSGPERWLLLGLLGGCIALLADALTGVTLRLPGAPAVFYTLLGLLWGICRTPTAEPPSVPSQTPGGRDIPVRIGNVAMGLVCIVAGVGAGWTALHNWRGVQSEVRAVAAFEQGRYEEALAATRAAQQNLLDPVRAVMARKRGLQSRFALAGAAHAALRQAPSTVPADAWEQAVALAQGVHQEAIQLNLTAPAVAQTETIAARSAEWLAELHARPQPAVALQWAKTAELAWRRQRQRDPYNVEALLALTRYPAPLSAHIELLRDALRFGDVEGPWRTALARFAPVPGFEKTLAIFIAAARPISPETDLDALVASMAPEAYRLAAAWYAIGRDVEQAATHAAHAAQLYRPMRTRFPKLYSVALGEEAAYRFQGSPTEPQRPIELLHEAIDALPVIQAQQYEKMVSPFRFRLALCLIADAQTEPALRMVKAALGERAADRNVVTHTLRFLLADAAAKGADEQKLTRVRKELCQEFPEICSSDDNE